MITREEVFDVDAFVPADLVHRNHELNLLSTALSPIIEGNTGSNTIVTGPSGVGKTTTARYGLTQLEAEADVKTRYVNCWNDHRPWMLLYDILDEVGRVWDLHRQSTAQDILLKRLRESVDKPYVVILDEVDRIDDTGLLYSLDAIPELTLVLITNREQELFASMDERVHSRFRSGVRIYCEPYRVSELVEILDARVREGMQYGVSESILERIADHAAGDARVAIRSLYRAAKLAGDGEVTSVVVDEAVPLARGELRQKTTSQLKPHESTLLEIVREHGPLKMGELQPLYVEASSDDRTARSLRRDLRKLADYNLVEARGETNGRRYVGL
ncbi:AAA family ATPase [Haloferax mediterranei ATCC 33500]|uniref:AAA family ATPase n=1 Tax=Haloferax mediterranei (strain ATCC 33500 / DSM 1411 / JCM 8866 / NBRC 14739 / NCIMB 2177 / R-4) TaxID=523841 RepID=I3R318_HALMT|nr:Cdc6/Cdc18 family protein [Haloferax mediterranei]AFK18628.1 cell division control protein cdc6-like protein [Haloferax mediterranei ATCC 33500]AHZ22001.1 cell division control protein Ccd6 [Haloferax mediterranei ATCC 33500]EMA02097.1 cell division control protein cdc6-like protein [Haloferax mediterranei ATCC 33500]MDX5988719.1 Cdc6/Cdc18 family protein [Haloferax mediterranei ATCC 33500]QCQ75127.1 AAA family ATPase [Haloferax mediterranei ATCC 33500]